MLEAMTLLTAAWKWVSPTTLLKCFMKAGVSSESQARSQSDDDDPFKLFHSLKNFKTGVNLPLILQLMAL